jgi:hypothetical protein
MPRHRVVQLRNSLADCASNQAIATFGLNSPGDWPRPD